MLKTVFSATLALMLGAAGASFAQSTETETTGQAEETTGQESTASDIESQLDLGEDANAPSSDLGKPYTKEEVGAWELRCIKTDQETDPCQLFQLILNGDGVPVAEYSMFRLPEGGKAVAGALVIVPLEVSLKHQLSISVDGGNARRYPYAFCNPVGCYARIGLTEADINAYKRGNNAVLSLVDWLNPDKEVKMELSLDGFTAGYEKVSIVQQ